MLVAYLRLSISQIDAQNADQASARHSGSADKGKTISLDIGVPGGRCAQAELRQYLPRPDKILPRVQRDSCPPVNLNSRNHGTRDRFLPELPLVLRHRQTTEPMPANVPNVPWRIQ